MSPSAPLIGVASIETACGFSRRRRKRVERDLTNRGQFDLASPVQHQAEDHGRPYRGAPRWSVSTAMLRTAEPITSCGSWKDCRR